MPPLTYSRRQLIPANAPSTPQISLPSRSGHTAFGCDFSGPILHTLNTDSPFALRRLLTVELCSPRGEVPWNIAVVKSRVLNLLRAMTRTVSVFNVWGFRMHAKRFMGFLNANFAKISVSKHSSLDLRCLKRSHPCFLVTPRRPPRPLVSYSRLGLLA